MGWWCCPLLGISPSGISYRSPQLWSNQATLVLTQEGAPELRSVLPTSSAGGTPYLADTSRFAGLIDVYTTLATSDPVTRVLGRRGLIDPKLLENGASPITAVAGRVHGRRGNDADDDDLRDSPDCRQGDQADPGGHDRIPCRGSFTTAFCQDPGQGQDPASGRQGRRRAEARQGEKQGVADARPSRWSDRDCCRGFHTGQRQLAVALRPVLTAASPEEAVDPLDASAGVSQSRLTLGPVPRSDIATAREEAGSSAVTRGDVRPSDQSPAQTRRRAMACPRRLRSRVRSCEGGDVRTSSELGARSVHASSR